MAVTGSAVFGAATALTATVIGRVTDRVIVPAFDQGRTTSAALALAAMAIVGISVIKAVGIVPGRFFAGIMQYRLQATYRRRVTRQYLRLPLSWHHRHPTGQLLSNANADVEAIWYPIAPLPMAVGVRGHARGRRGRARARPTWCWRWSASLVFPAIVRAERRSTSGACRR